jgi:hypothetical protein
MAQDIRAMLRLEAWAHSVLETNKLFSSTFFANKNVESHYPPKLSGRSSIFKLPRLKKFMAKRNKDASTVSTNSAQTG